VSLIINVAGALHERERELWLSYAENEKNGARKQAGILRAKLIAAIQAYPSEERAHFALAFVELARRSRTQRFPIRRDIFYALVLPVLVARHDAGVAGAARDLLVFDEYLSSVKPFLDVVGDRHLSVYTLLREAMDEHPDDAALKYLWIARKAEGFEYTFHEVPSGVLYGNGGASVAECAELLVELDAFERIVAEVGRSEKYRERVRRWRHYAAGYREYLLNRDKYEWFGAYLERHPLT
jgi:hypothetical protein